ncbi:holin family protein [Paracoccus onubensis]|uniref:holin family protein n=1 Tax=Paracoccus onubensis TaxID=1675788 RepID=UPI0027300B97|nr:holin family protein [Paracoccus onubensis]MDP0925825.1 holin family protein [Paracoccus onubensis]
MGLIGRFVRGQGATALGSAVGGVAEIFVQNATRRMELDEAAYARAVTQFGQEFMGRDGGWFDSIVNGLNRLPRPLLALGTMALFGYAMIEPTGFGLRMEGLQQVPEPLWWLLGAIVGFYFCAREAHYFRNRHWPAKGAEPAAQRAVQVPEDDFPDNAALRDWAANMRKRQ